MLCSSLVHSQIDLYISADVKHPTADFGSTWISRDYGNDHITIPTYTEDYENSNSHTLYVGVHNRVMGGAWDDGSLIQPFPVPFSLDVAIVDVSEGDILKRGNLRANGQRILPGQAPPLDDVRKGRATYKRFQKESNYAV